MRTTSLQHRLLLAVAVDRLVDAGILELDEPEVPFEERHQYRYLRTTIDGDIPALICLSRPYKDQWTVTIALWPSDDAEPRMGVMNAREAPGGAFAAGWLNRWQFKRARFDIEHFHNARALVNRDRRKRIAAITVPANGEAIRLMALYPLSHDGSGQFSAAA